MTCFWWMIHTTYMNSRNATKKLIDKRAKNYLCSSFWRKILNQGLLEFIWSRCQKLAEHLSIHIKYCDLHLKENAEKANFISPKKLLLGHLGLRGLTNFGTLINLERRVNILPALDNGGSVIELEHALTNLKI